MKLALFDFDGTLIKKDSFILFSIYSQKKISVIKAYIKILPEFLLAKLGIIAIERVKERLFKYLYSGIRIEQFNNLCENFIKIIDKHKNVKLLNLVEEFKRENSKLVIVSASISNWIEPWAREYGFNSIIATEIEIDKNGIITGNFKTRNCKRKEKVNRVLEKFPNIHKYEIYAFGNSKGDKEMMEFAKFSFILNRWNNNLNLINKISN